MLIRQENFQHPTQASTVRLNVYEIANTPAPVFGMDTLMRPGRFLVTEDRTGTSTVVSTLGSFATKDEALTLVDQRAAALVAQRYTPRPNA
jgi:hypothetical protein